MLIPKRARPPIGDLPPVYEEEYISVIPDPLKTMKVSEIGLEGMKIDRMLFGHFSEEIRKHDIIKNWVMDGNFRAAEQYVREEIFDKPEEYYDLDKLQKSTQVDRKLTIREILEKVFNLIPKFKTKEDLLNEECDKFISIYKPAMEFILPIKNFLKVYISDPFVRDVIESGEYAKLATSPVQNDFRALNNEWRKLIPEYVRDYISLNTYA